MKIQLISILVLSLFYIGIAHGQSDIQIYVTNHGGIQPLRDINKLLDITVPATLAGISIIAGNFLVVYKPHEKYINKIKLAEKDFFRSFYFLLINTVLILGLSIAEIFSPASSEIELLDIAIKYTLFAIGLLYLFKGTRSVMIVITKTNHEY